MSVWWAVLLAVWFVLANGFFVVVETSLFAARPERLEAMEQREVAGASSALAALSAPERPLATSQLGISAVSVLLGWAVAPVLGEPVQELLEVLSVPASVATPVGLVVGLVLVVVVHMVLGEVVPRSVTIAAPERAASYTLPVHRVVVVVLRPAVATLFGVARWLARGLRVTAGGVGRARTADQLALLVGESVAGGELADTERELLTGALSFHGVHVGDVMAPRDELVTVPQLATVAQAEQLVHRSGHSRVLVVDDDDHVTGFLHVKDLISLGPEHQPQLLPPGLVRVALRVAPEDALDTVLLRMRRARRHVAVVTSGPASAPQVVGLVTLEDILEALVGDIRDESDREEPT